jgi:hypothetical protein
LFTDDDNAVTFSIILLPSQPMYVGIGTYTLLYIFHIEIDSKKVRFTGREKENGMKREFSAVPQ